jgi:hypothetical protein
MLGKKGRISPPLPIMSGGIKSSGRASTMARDVLEVAGRIRTLFGAGVLGDGQLLEL